MIDTPHPLPEAQYFTTIRTYFYGTESALNCWIIEKRKFYFNSIKIIVNVLQHFFNKEPVFIQELFFRK